MRGRCTAAVRSGAVAAERAFLEAIEPAFTELVGSDEQHLYVGGASRLLAEMRWADMTEINDLMHRWRSG